MVCRFVEGYWIVATRALAVLAAVCVFLTACLIARTGPSGGTSDPFLFSRAVLGQGARGYTPAQVRFAYGLESLYARGFDGTGQTVALIETDAFRPSDIRTFDAAYGLPQPVIEQRYAGGPPFATIPGGETTLDVEWLHAMAPGARIQVYFLQNYVDSPQSGWRNMAAVLREADANGASVIGISLGACGPAGSQATRTALAALMRVGISVFVASGDFGAHPGPTVACGHHIGLAYPSGDPSVVSVGGTSLALQGDGAILSETAWRESGGGMLSAVPRPAWQGAPTMPPDIFRWAPDVSFVGDPYTGVSVYYAGAWREVGGTSVGAPAWAGIWALIRARGAQRGVAVGAAGPLLYQIANSSDYGDAFHDITSGWNGRYYAKEGWDAVTGWGTPNAERLSRLVLDAVGAP